MDKLLIIVILVLPSIAQAAIPAEEIIPRSTSLFVGALACFSMILGYMLNR